MSRDLHHTLLAALASFTGVILFGCAGTQSLSGQAIEQIKFESQPPPFCGRCETLSFTVRSDGEVRIEKGYFAGDYRDWRRERSVRHVSVERFAEFKRRLSAYKPQQDLIPQGDEGCKAYSPDNDGAMVEWSGDGETRRRVFDFSCEDDLMMNKTVREAPHALGL